MFHYQEPKDSGLFKQFDDLDCTNRQCLEQGYMAGQEEMYNYKIDAMSTFMRCFKRPTQESKLWTDTYKTRFYTDFDCQRKPPACAEPMSFRGITGKRTFFTNTSCKDGFYPDEYRPSCCGDVPQDQTNVIPGECQHLYMNCCETQKVESRRHPLHQAHRFYTHPPAIPAGGKGVSPWNSCVKPTDVCDGYITRK
jgi:hypothetical protein